ncbi:hypothetical protein M378DRAFT_181147 [Amanita muscaria Koide BX008]|uniref:N-acetyltransferase domain-containing protein n=1 Tax=Amanita muscaria (strain Koide BX008) TaxID=946122 RepID=A0A0C2SX40_AMAMK|nr:hypothetical protein M378DRAFT_181147 [Amanita muscaria Koide BX008]
MWWGMRIICRLLREHHIGVWGRAELSGRSSHICNAGLIIPAIHRGIGYGLTSAWSYFRYMSRLGFKMSASSASATTLTYCSLRNTENTNITLTDVLNMNTA